jgi:hypothetical protein
LPDHKTSWLAARPLGIAFGAAALAGGLLPAAAAATPTILITCSGGLTKAVATIDDTHPLKYAFRCNGDISAYTLVVNRQPNDFSTLDDFSPTATVLDPTNTLVSGTESIGCQGIVPGNGVNCFAQSTATPPAITANNWVQGMVDTTDPYCPSIPAGSKPGTAAEPRAVVQLVVSDTSGDEFGPYPLSLTPACPPAPKPKAATKKKPKGKKSGHKAAHKKK